MKTYSHSILADLSLFLFLIFIFSGAAMAADLTVGQYQLISSKRVDRTTWEYNYKASITNSGTIDVSNVTATAESLSTACRIVNGALSFGTVPSQQVVQSSNTFTIRVNRTSGLAASDLKWKISGSTDTGVLQTVGTEGGTVTVASPTSPIVGAKVVIPAGALANDSIITITIQSNPPAKALPDGAVNDGPCISFKSSEDHFLLPVYVMIPFEGERQKDESRLVYTYNESTGVWEMVIPMPTPNSNLFIGETTHFSDYQKGKAIISDADISASFQIGRDTARYNNDGSFSCENNSEGGICSGIATLSARYFNSWAESFGESLMCRWAKDNSAAIACSVYGEYLKELRAIYPQHWWLSIIDRIEALSSPLNDVDHRYVIDAIKANAKHNKVTSIFLYSSSLLNPKAHAAVAYGWYKDPSGIENLKLYDVNYNNQGMTATYSSNKLVYTDPNGVSWDVLKIDPVSSDDFWKTVDDLIQGKASDNACSLSSSTYSYTTLLPPGWQTAEVMKMNIDGQIVGRGVNESGRYCCFLYYNGEYSSLIPDGWSYSYNCFINNRGHVVGYGLDPMYGPRNFLYVDGTYTIPFLSSGWLSPSAINNNDQITGGILDENNEPREYLYKEGYFTKLLPQGWQSATSMDINDSGDVIGIGKDEFGQNKGYLYSNGTYTILTPGGWTETVPVSINNAGQTVGYSTSYDGLEQRGFLYDKGVYTILVHLGAQHTGAFSINNRGDIVGNAVYDGFLYRNGQYTTLSCPGWRSLAPIHINDDGQIIGTGTDGAGRKIGFFYSDGVFKTVLPDNWQSSFAYWLASGGRVAGAGLDATGQWRYFLAIPK